jgi:hypothetical protein
MNGQCVHPQPCNRRHLFFITSVKLKTIQITTQKIGDLSFEFVYGKNIMVSKGFHTIDSKTRIKSINETVEIPMQAVFDRRKNRFSTDSIQLNIINHHLSFNKRIGVVSLNLSEVLNSQKTYLIGNYRIEKCVDKAAMLTLGIHLKFIGFNLNPQSSDKIDESYFSVSSIRRDNKSDR